MMTSRPPAVPERLPGPVVVRRRQEIREGLPLPQNLTAAAVWRTDPDRWKRERFEWSRQHQWPPGRIGFLAFFRETTDLHQKAKGRQL